MSPIDVSTALTISMRKADTRAAAMLALHQLGAATPARLAEAIGVSSNRLHMILHGELPYYRPEISPVALGHVAIEETPFGVSVRLTEQGRAAIPEILRIVDEKESRARRIRERAKAAIVRAHAERAAAPEPAYGRHLPPI